MIDPKVRLREGMPVMVSKRGTSYLCTLAYYCPETGYWVMRELGPLHSALPENIIPVPASEAIYPTLEDLLLAHGIRNLKSRCWEYVKEGESTLGVRIKTMATGNVWITFHAAERLPSGAHVRYSRIFTAT